MAAQNFYSQDFTDGNELTGDELDTIQEEAQAEFEKRSSEQLGSGVCDSTSFVGTIDAGADAVDFVAGAGAYHLGKRFATGGSVSFSGSDAADTYYLYLAASTGALAKSTSVPAASAGLLLYSVTWNGSDTLSALTDLRVVGFVGTAQLQVKTISGTQEINLPLSSSMEVTLDHEADAEFALPLHFEAYCDDPVTITPLSSRSNGDKTDGAHVCLLLENESDYGYDYEYGYTTTLRWSRTGLML